MHFKAGLDAVKKQNTEAKTYLIFLSKARIYFVVNTLLYLYNKLKKEKQLISFLVRAVNSFSQFMYLPGNHFIMYRKKLHMYI